VAGRYLGLKPDGNRVTIVYSALARVLPGLHVIVFAPADWPEEESSGIEDDGSDVSASLTPREVEILALAAEGLSAPELAQQLGLSSYTVKSHFKNIHAKLHVRNRAAAVAKALRLGLIG
jgi:DNA-binding CsgD family transcriptional regulator